MTAQTRDRIVHAGAQLFRTHGYTGTGVKQISEQARAPFGSLYHFFPGGKTQIGEEVIRTSGRLYLQIFVQIAAESGDAVQTTRAFFDGAAQTLEETDFVDACPIATVALEVSSTSEPLRLACAEVFTEWIDGAGAYYAHTGGLPEARARALALAILSLLEGAFVFARALRSAEPVLRAGDAAVALVQAAQAS